MLKHARRATIALTTSALLSVALNGCGAETDTGQPGSQDGAQSSPTAEEPSAEADARSGAAASWLAGQLEDGLIIASYENPPGSGKWSSSPDYGLSLDAFYALQGHDELADEASGILDAIEPQVSSYVGTGKDAYAGSLGKLLTAVQVGGTPLEGYAQGDLLRKLEGLVVGTGDEAGRAKDTWAPSNEFGGDYSNTIGQSWVVRALTEAGSDVADESLAFLLAQQCSEGYFRLLMDSRDFTCDSGTPKQSTPSADATGLAVLALLEAQEAGIGGQQDIEAALARAEEWLLSAQAEDGSFADADTGAGNANSTGVAGEALLALDETEAAAKAAQWLADHQVTEEAADGSRLADAVGAVAYDHAALSKALDKGIGRGDRNQWQRATAQAVAALDALP